MLFPAPLPYSPETENPNSDANMPRGGSKKGEHRGAAKREAKRKPGPPKGVSGNPKGKSKGTLNRETKERLKVIGAEIGMAEVSGLMPKDMMLNIARTFMAMALKEQRELQAEPTDELNGAYERHLVLAGDMAYKAGAYYHPRLQALMVGGSSDKSPGDVLRSMLEEIDGEARLERQQVRQIEHEPTETTVEVLKVNEG